MLQAFLDLKSIYQGFDDGARYLEAEIKTPLCIDKCGRCCQHNTVPATTIEALYAVSVLTGNGKIAAAVQRAEDWLLTRHPEASSYEGMLDRRFVSSSIRQEYNSLSAGQCPFLDERLSCTVWEARPAVCRAYGVTRSNIGLCPRPAGLGESMSYFRYLEPAELRAVWEAFRASCTQRNPEWMVAGFFPAMVYRAARNKEFYKLVKDNRVATAKVIGVNVDTNIMWQPQVESINKGILPELALMAR